MQYKDAAFQILHGAGQPLHYSEISDRAIKAGLLVPKGTTPEATMAALLYTDTLKESSRFVRDDKRGYFGLKGKQADTIDRQVDRINTEVRHQLLEILHQMAPNEFENLIAALLLAIGMDENSIKVTPFSKDGGVDVRGKMIAGGLTEVNVAVQAKRWKNKVTAKTVRELRGSLKTNEQGIIITTKGFTKDAIDEACADAMEKISLIDGDQLVELLITNRSGANAKQYSVNYIDENWWSSFGVDVIKLIAKPATGGKHAPKVDGGGSIYFPIQVQREHNGQMYQAELMDLNGHIKLLGKVYDTVTAAAKTITTDWKSVSGWTFWKYFDDKTGKWQTIDNLCPKK